MTKETLKAFTPVIRPPEQISLTENSRQVLKKRYLRRGPDGNPSETIEGMFHRVASAVAEPDAAHGYDVATTEASFYGLLTSLRFFPNSPTFTGAGTPLGQLAACFTAGMRVTTENGIKPIIDLRPGDRVLTHRGRYRPVTEVFQRAYQGELLRIKVDLIGTTLEVTPEHPILTPGGWVKAGELKVGDAVAIGIPVGERPAATFDLAQLVYADELEVQTETETIRVRRPSSYQNSGRQANWQRRFVELTPDLARLCGYYISEGTIGPDERYIRFTFGTAEEVYAADVIDLMERLFGVPVNRSTSNFGNWQNLNFYSRAMTAWFAQNFGRHSYGKSIPVWLQYATPEVQEAFLVGTMRGDGLYYEKLQVVQGRTAPKLFRSLRLTLSNPGLIQQIWQMCLRLGYDAAVRPVDTTYVTENARVTAQVSLPPLQSRHLVEAAFGKTLPEPDPRYIRNTVRREEGRVFFRIASIEADDFTGTVYNCEVDEDHSYVTEGVVVHNCFVLPISDDMGRESDGIFQTLRDAALIQQTGGGNGFSFSRLRPKGDSVASSAGVATGPVGFLRVYDSAFGEVAQGGTRRGANMAVLRVDHPDIEEFITCKAEEGQIANFNISAGITDAFMRAVEADSDFDLINPRDGKVWRTVKARDLFDLIVTYAHHNGEPGALFLDAANRTNPLPHLYTLDATNPCGEQFLGPYENCCLGSINLAQHITADGQVDWEKLRESVVVATRFLDNVVDANKYVPAVPQLREAALRARRIGLGLMGLGDLMYALGVRYGSEEGQEFAAQVMEFIRYHCMLTSIELAEERGPFPAIKGSIYDPENLLWRPPTPITSYTRDWGRPLLDWDRVVQGIVEHGIRNAAQTTIAPTGTIGTVTGCEGYGCEPVFALAYTRTVKDNEKDLKLTYTSPLFEKALIAAGLDEATRQRISEQVSVTGSCQDVAEVPEAIRRVFVVASDITAEEHVRMQAALQAFVDNSISKCVTGETLVLTKSGLTPIAEFSEMRLPDQFDSLDLDVITPSGVERADAFYYGAWRETRAVRLSYGYRIEGTPNHRVQVLDESGAVRFARLDELKVGDTVVLYAGQQIFGAAGQPLPGYRGEFRTAAKDVRFPESMSSDLAYILGCITSEGAITRNGVSITNGDRKLLERLGVLFEQQFGLTWHITQDMRRASVYTLQVNSRPLRNWLLADLGLESGARNKIIPTCILRASRHEIAAFLRGLFLDGYMTQDGRMFGIGLASRGLLEQLQVLLLNFGVLSRLHRSADHAWSLTVAGEALERLAGFVEFDETWKSQRLMLRNEGREHHIFNYAGLLPADITAAMRRMQAKSNRSLRSLYAEQASAYQRARVNLLQGHRLDRSTATSLYEHFNDTTDSFTDNFFAHDAADRYYVRVEQIEAGFAEVFDISVPGSHSFVANGLGNHNTINFPAQATVQDVKDAYRLAWHLGCKGLTVYVTGSRQEVVLETKATAEAKGKGTEKRDGGAGEQSAEHSPTIEVSYPALKRRPRPAALRGLTYRKETPLGTAYVTVNVNGGEQPFEVFMNVGKAGSDVAAVSEALGRLISLVLRLPSPLDATERLKMVVDQLAGIGGGRSMGFGANRVRSLPDAVAQVLREHLNSHYGDDELATVLIPEVHAHVEQLPLPIADRPIGDLCPDCGQATFIPTEGCRKCYACGYSEC